MSTDLEAPSALEAERKRQADAVVAHVARKRTRGPRIVFIWGRFNPPTTGHARLFQFAGELASRQKADLVIFPSMGTGPKDPLPPLVKIHYLRKLFPGVKVNGNTKVRTIVDCLEMISRKYREATLVVGSDRASDFGRLQKYYPGLTLDVVAMPGGRTAQDTVEGMSASKQRAAAVAGDYESFRKGVPTTNDSLAEQLYTSVRHYMGIKESKGTAFLLYGTSPKAVAPLVEAFSTLPIGKKMWRDVTGKAFADIKRLHTMAESKGYKVVIYTRDLPVLTESVIRHKTTLGLLKEAYARDIIDVQSRGDVYAAGDVALHAKNLLEAEGAKPKAPSEVDRLRIQQQRETLLTKQRQEQELLAAKQRELNKKAREASSKLANKR